MRKAICKILWTMLILVSVVCLGAGIYLMATSNVEQEQRDDLGVAMIIIGATAISAVGAYFFPCLDETETTSRTSARTKAPLENFYEAIKQIDLRKLSNKELSEYQNKIDKESEYISAEMMERRYRVLTSKRYDKD